MRPVCTVASSVCLFFSLLGCGSSDTSSTTNSASAGTPGAEEALGERLFLETRFAQAFKVFLDNGGDINDPNAKDPVMNTVETIVPGSPINPGPFKGMSMNCRACHLVDDVIGSPGGSMRTYADFARRSPIPARADGKTHAPRNSPPLVNSTLARPGGVLFHFDTEFNSMEDLVVGTFTGRNFGWLPGERAQAISHIARVVRSDDGSFDLTDTGLPYRILFTGTNPDIPDELRLPPQFRAYVGSGTDEEIFAAVVKVVAAYVNGLRFSQTDDNGRLIRSPYDVFLQINGLPQRPNPSESDIDYSRRLRTLLNGLTTPQFVTLNPNRPNGQFQFHSQSFQFGEAEFEGLKMFLAEPAAIPASAGELAAGKIGNCVSCHAAPNFTDFKLHNTGVTQQEFDDPAIGAGHSAGAFAALAIPSLATRTPNDLPASELHPNASERFRAIPSDGTTLTDLGVWNVFANPNMPGPQAKIRTILCDDQDPCPLAEGDLLDRALARFKTPGLRDLGHSAPYMHNGRFDTVEDVVGFYLGMSNLERAGLLRNGADALGGIALNPADIPPLATFLKSLNEDYQ